MKKNGQHLYKWAWLGLLPLLGILAGVVLMAAGFFRYKNIKLFLAGTTAVLASLILSVFLFLNMSRSTEEASSTDGNFETVDSTSRDTDLVDVMEPLSIPEANSLPANPFDEVFGSILSIRTDSGNKQFRFQQLNKKERIVNEDRSGNTKQQAAPGSYIKTGISRNTTNK